MKRHRPLYNMPGDTLASRALFEHRDGWQNKTEHRNQDAPALDTAHDAKHSTSGIFQSSEAIRVKLWNAYAIQNLLVHVPTPCQLRLQHTPLSDSAQLKSWLSCGPLNNFRGTVARSQHCNSGSNRNCTFARHHFLRSSQITNPNPANVNAMTPSQSRHSSGVMS